MQHPQCITIDGPVGAGKSTIGEKLADRLGYIYVDTGVMYRAVTLLALRNNVDVHDTKGLESLAMHADIAISLPTVADGRQYTVLVHGEDVTWEIRLPDVGRNVPDVSLCAEVRAILVAKQRVIATTHHVVMVGRDIGSIVVPDAELKLYLTASPQERAHRRRLELLERYAVHPGLPEVPTFEAVLEDLQRRDSIDSVNMQPAPDAHIINSDGLTIAQVMEKIMELVAHVQAAFVTE